MREELRETIVHRLDEQGNIVQECTMQTVQVLSKARRIRYTRHFFPASTADLRLRLFSEIGDAHELAIDQAAFPDIKDELNQAHADSSVRENGDKPSPWVLYE